MRWAGQRLGADAGLVLDLGGGDEPGAASATAIPGLLRTVRTPDFAGVTFHEVLAKSVLNEVPGSSPMPFAWTVNPYRGCTHACRYCFARNTHTYLDLDAGADFDSQIVVKVNVAEVLTRELARGRNRREHVALGTNTDPYQRAEGRYRLMPGILRALAASGSPVSVLTKGTLLARDLPLLASIAREVPVGLGVSIALVDRELQQHLEPGTPTPAARLELVRRATDLGLSVGVMVAPVLPHLTDSDEALDATLGAVAAAGAAGATGATVLALHLRPGAREWYLGWLAGYRPDLLPAYEALYPRGPYARKQYTADLAARVGPLRRRHGLAGAMHRDTVLGESWPVGSLPPAAAEGIGRATATVATGGSDVVEQLALDLGLPAGGSRATLPDGEPLRWGLGPRPGST